MKCDSAFRGVEQLAIDGEPTNETFRNFMDNKIAEAVIRVCPKCGTSILFIIGFGTYLSFF